MIFLVGQHCAGKSRISLFFSRAQFLCIDLGPLLRDIHRRMSSHLGFAEWVRAGEGMEGKSFTDTRLAEEISLQLTNGRQHYWQDILIVGSRSVDGVRYLSERIGPYQGRKDIIVWVEAPVPILYGRYCLRHQNDSLSYQAFLGLLEADDKLGLSGLRNAAEFELPNIGSEYELEVHVLALIRRLGYEQEPNV